MKLLYFRFHIVMLDLQVILTFLGLLTSGESEDVRVPTPLRIARDGYPVSTFEVTTKDSYILNVFRIPYSPKRIGRNNNYTENKPIVFIQHGLWCSSDCWILNGHENSLPYMLADEGYDVWLGNARGNIYSKNHTRYKTTSEKFWSFSWHEIGVYDVSAMIDFILDKTGETSLHYVGHSQGTTVFFVLMSMLPQYNIKIRTAHMLSPVVFMENMKTPLATVAAPLLGRRTILTEIFENQEFLPNSRMRALLRSQACNSDSLMQPACSNFLFLIFGWDSQYFNMTLLPEALKTVPAGCSINQFIHFLQEYNSGRFRRYDYGSSENRKVYGQRTPPDYDLSLVEAPVYLYHSENDYWSEVEDVEKLANILPNLIFTYKIPLPKFNHLDFQWAFNVKTYVNDPVVNFINDYEKEDCKYFSNKFFKHYCFILSVLRLTSLKFLKKK